MLIFFHIPKTAGTTFLEILEKEYSNSYTIDGINWGESLKEINSWGDEKVKELDLIKGHMSYSLKRHKSPLLQNATYVSFFREPVSLFVSTYNYIKRAKLNRYHQVIQKMSLEEWVDFRKDEQLDNLQSRHLLERLPIFNPNCQDLNLRKSKNEKLFRELDLRLATIDYTFTVNNFDRALLFLHEELRWSRMPYYKRRNTSTNDLRFSDALLKRIESLNWLDKYLYEQVKSLEKTKLMSVPDEQLNMFQKRNNSTILNFIRK